jgi:hypothetical protein
VAGVNNTNVRDLSQLCDEFAFTKLAKIVGDWQPERVLVDTGIRGELDLVQAALKERRESQDRTTLILDQAFH